MSNFAAMGDYKKRRDSRRSSTRVKGFGLLEGYNLNAGEIPSDQELANIMRGKNAAQKKALLD